MPLFSTRTVLSLQVRAFGSVSEWMAPVGMERITSSLLVQPAHDIASQRSLSGPCSRRSSLFDHSHAVADCACPLTVLRT